jgi:biofilm regulator BssR
LLRVSDCFHSPYLLTSRSAFLTSETAAQPSAGAACVKDRQKENIIDQTHAFGQKAAILLVCPMADKGGKNMTADELARRLVMKLMAARTDLAAYIQMRKAKGYMSVNENDRLREMFFALALEIRDKSERLQEIQDRDTRSAMYSAEEALSSAAVSLMSGRRDCANFISVNVDKLERSLNILDYSIQYLNEHSPLAEA